MTKEFCLNIYLWKCHSMIGRWRKAKKKFPNLELITLGDLSHLQIKLTKELIDVNNNIINRLQDFSKLTDLRSAKAFDEEAMWVEGFNALLKAALEKAKSKNL